MGHDWIWPRGCGFCRKQLEMKKQKHNHENKNKENGELVTFSQHLVSLSLIPLGRKIHNLCLTSDTIWSTKFSSGARNPPSGLAFSARLN